jgi:hypothetical protein
MRRGGGGGDVAAAVEVFVGGVETETFLFCLGLRGLVSSVGYVDLR